MYISLSGEPLSNSVMNPFFFLFLAAIVFMAPHRVFAQAPGQAVDCRPILAQAGYQNAPAFVPIVTARGLPKQLEGKAHLALCRGLFGALQVAGDIGEDVPWMLSLPVEFVPELGGLELQAQFERKLLTSRPRVLQATVGVIQHYSADELLWLFGHELGHGVMHHKEKQMGTRAGGAFVGLVGAGGAVVGKTVLRRGAAAAVGAAGVATAVCGPAKVSLRHELQADEFGVRVLQRMGASLSSAKTVAAQLMQKSPSPEETCSSTLGTGKSTHPSSAERAQAIQALK